MDPDRLKILVVDDDAVERAMVRSAIEASDLPAEIAESISGTAAIELLSTEPFDCALIDQEMPDVDGLAVLRAIRAAAVITPVILLTGQGDDRLVVEAMRAGANDSLSKSRLSRDLLAHSIRNAVRLRRAQTEANLALGLRAESEQRFQAMADSAPVLLWMSDPDGSGIYFNPQWLAFTGRTLDQERGDGWLSGIHPQDLERSRDAVRAAMAERRKFQVELRLRRNDGQYRWMIDTGAPRFLPDGRLAGYIGSCVDITERKSSEEERTSLLKSEQAARAAADAARAAAQASEQRYRVLAEVLPAIIWTADPDGRADYFNPRWYDYSGATIEDSLGTAWTAWVYDADLRRVESLWTTALATGQPYEAELRYRRGSDDAYRWHLVRALPLRDETGGIVKWFGTGVDIDDQKRAQESIRFLAEASVALASSLDYETTLTAVARLAVPDIADWCAIDMLEPDGTLRGLTFYNVDQAKIALAEELRRRYPPRMDAPFGPPQVLRTGKPELYARVSVDLINMIAQDDDHAQAMESMGYRSIMIVPMFSRDRALGTITLITAESGRDYRKEDLAFAEDLAGRAAAAVDNASLYKALSDAKDGAEAANTAKDQFLAVLSHELRTPLSPVLTTVQLLESEPDLSPDMRDSLGMIRRNVELEARLIDDLLDLTRIAKGKLELNIEVVDVHAALHDVVRICEEEQKAKGLSLEMDLSATVRFVRADPARLQQVFWNLFKNAVKFTPTGGNVILRTFNIPPARSAGGNGNGAADADARERLRIEVRDTGIGIEPDVLPRIFDAFEQGERSITRRFGGLGLGLAISKALMEMKNGHLTADSEGKGLGAVFGVDLSTVDAPESARSMSTPPPPQGMSADGAAHSSVNGEPLRILLVDDHEDTAQAMGRLLKKLGYQVEIAGNVAQAIAAFERERADLLISDIGLPDGSGLDLMRQLSLRSADRPLRGIALSGFGMEEDLRKSREAGFIDHLTKPINFQKLESVIHRATSAAAIAQPTM